MIKGYSDLWFNKKALFYNLTNYFNYIQEDVFQVIPVTFHIKNADSRFKMRTVNGIDDGGLVAQK